MFILLALLFGPQSEAATVVFNLKGTQHVQNLEADEKLCDECQVVWDERRDPQLPQGAPLGYGERFEEITEKTKTICRKYEGLECVEEVQEKYNEVIPYLRENAAMKAAKLTRDATQAQEENARATLKSELLAIKAKLDADQTPTAAEQRKIMREQLKRLLLGM